MISSLSTYFLVGSLFALVVGLIGPYHLDSWSRKLRIRFLPLDQLDVMQAYACLILAMLVAWPIVLLGLFIVIPIQLLYHKYLQKGNA